jgi:hypothetical protein
VALRHAWLRVLPALVFQGACSQDALLINARFCDRRLSALAVLSFRASSVILVGAGRLRPTGVVKVLDRWLKRLGQIACLVGLHDFRVVEVTFGFGGSDAIEKLECRRCGRTAARRA